MADVLVDKKVWHDDALLEGLDDDEAFDDFKDWKAKRLEREAAYYDRCQDEQ